MIDIELNVHHIASTLNLLIYTNLDEDSNNESWGMRNVQLFSQ
jgi:hypothetical protein